VSEFTLDVLPDQTRANFLRLRDDPRLAGFTLVGGTALSLQISHRLSEDLDFNVFGQHLPRRQLDALISELESVGVRIDSLISPDKKSAFRINTGYNLDDFIQDYLMDGSKVTFHARLAPERPVRQIEFLQSTPKLKAGERGFDLMGLDGLFVMKVLVTYDRVRSRDLFDLMVLTRDHEFTAEQLFAAVEAYLPARNRDPDHFKNVVTGIIPVDRDDEGFEAIRLDVTMREIYDYFTDWVSRYESERAMSLFLELKSGRPEKPG
jgi:hypothetical protein